MIKINKRAKYLTAIEMQCEETNNKLSSVRIQKSDNSIVCLVTQQGADTFSALPERLGVDRMWTELNECGVPCRQFLYHDILVREV